MVALQPDAARWHIAAYWAAILLVVGVFSACGADARTAVTGVGSTTGANTATTATSTTPPSATDTPGGPLRGFALSPPNFESDGFLGFFETAAPEADLIERVADILELEEFSGAGIAVVDSLADQYGYESVFGPYVGSASKQARFLERLGELIEDTDVAFYIWSFLYDQPTIEPFSSMGLITATGEERLGWDTWKRLQP